MPRTGRPKNDRKGELVRLAQALHNNPAASNLELARELGISRNRVPDLRRELENNGHVEERQVARAAARKATKEEIVSRVVAIWNKHHHLGDVCRDLRENHPDLPKSESHVRKILRDNGISVGERMFNLIKRKPTIKYIPAFPWYSQDYERKGNFEARFREERRRRKKAEAAKQVCGKDTTYRKA